MSDRPPTRPQRGERNPLGRVPPHDLTLERGLLGAALLYPHTANLVAAQPADLCYQHAHQAIHAAITALVATDKPVDFGTIAFQLRTQGELDAIGGPAVLTDLIATGTTAGHATSYVDELVELMHRRRTLTLAASLVDAVYAGGDTQGLAGELADSARHAALARTSSWEPINLAHALAGEGDALEPVLLRRADGRALLYPGKVHSFIGEPESGKTWLALLCCAQILLGRGHVLYIDFEDNEVAVTSRLLELGVDPSLILECFHYVRPDEALNAAAIARLEHIADTWNIELAVIDGVAEALALNGWDENKASDVTNLYVRLCRPLAARGAAVVTIDHVVKDKEQQGRYARGSTAKLAAIDGAVYKVEAFKAFGRGLLGAARITVTKDRHGYIRSVAVGGRIIGELTLDSRDELTLKLTAPATQSDGEWRPTRLMEKVSRLVETTPDMTSNAIVSAVGGKADTARKALGYLVEDGFVVTATGPNRSIRHRSAKPYREPIDDSDYDSRRYGNP